MKKHIITTLFTTVIGCTTAFAQTDGEIGANGDEGASSGTILSYLKEADIDYVGDGLIGHKLDIYYPDDGKETHNVIIHIYGSAWRSNNSKGSADLGTVGLAALKAGYIFVTPNHRSLNDALWPAQINDIKAVVRYLRGNKKDLKIDDSFIAISGYSSGGHLASMMGVTNGETMVKVGSEPIDIEGTLGNFRDESSRVDAVCDWSGPVDSRDKTCGNPINIYPENEILGDCTPQECPDKHASLATTTYLDAKDVPHMICHGSNDNIVPVCEAEKYRDNLEKAGIYVEWYNSDYGHEVVEDYTDEMISFFDKVRSGEVGQGSSSDSFDPCSNTTAYSDGSIIADNAVKDLGNGYNAELWRETNSGSMTVFGGKADCAFKANWDNSGDFLARVGYYDGNASKEYTDLGEIYAVYNYSKKGDGGGKYSYIGVYGWTKNPTIEYYIVDDSFTPDGDGMFWDTETKGTYKVDGVEYTLKVGIRNNYPSILGNTSFKQVFAVRSSYQTCGSINVTEHFKNWENLGIKMGNIYDCKIHCEVGGGTGSIEYTCASMSWKGQNSSFGKLNSSNIDNPNIDDPNIDDPNIDDPNIDDPGTPSDCVDPSTYTKKYSGGTTITSNCIRSVGNGYVVETWSEMNNGSATVFGDKADCAFKAEWDNSGDFLAQVGYYDAPATKTYTDLGEIYAVYNYSKTGDGGGIYSYIGIYGWTKNPLIEYYIVDDTFSPDGTGMFYGTEEIGTYKVDSVEYTLRIGQRIGAACIEGMADFKQIFAVRSSYQTCGKINVTEHFMNWEKLGVKMGGLYSCKIQCEVGGGTGSIEYTCASMSWDGQNSSLGKLNCDSTVKEEEIEKSDSINIYPCSYTTKYSGGTTITSNCLRDLGNGYNAEMWGERNNGSMTLFGGEAGCAFKAEWDNTGDFLARVGYYDAKASKKYTDLGEIYAIYNYIKSGDGGGSYSYIGVYGWTKNPMIEYYIVDDTFTPDSEDLFWGTNEIGTYKVDGVEYTLMVGQRINAPCIEGSASFKQIFAVRSSYQTCGIINVSEHFRNWEELGVKMGYIYDCKLLCEVGGGTGSIEYTCASMSWKGKKFTLGSLRNGEGDDTQITSAATYSDTKEFTIMPNPASTEIYIISEGEVEDVMIFNAIGDEVARADESKVDISSLPTGIYFVKATIDGESVVKKLVVTK
jgi:acetyl esterase/lipase